MKFFYKDKEINRRDEICNQLIKNGSELASVIFEKLQDTDESYKIFRHDYTKEGDSHFDFFVGSVRNGEISTIFTPVGELIFSRLSKSKYGAVSEVTLDNVKSHINPETLEIAQEIYGSYCKKVLEKKVTDKFGEEYTLKIIENSDTALSNDLYLNTVLLFKENKVVGYLKSCYTTPELSSKYSDKDKSPDFLNVANVDYSRINDNFKGRGLGYIIYFHMAQFLNQNGIEFRQSTMCSDSATRVWDKMKELWPENIQEKQVFGGNIRKFLAIGKEYNLEFVENRPQVKRLKMS